MRHLLEQARRGGRRRLPKVPGRADERAAPDAASDNSRVADLLLVMMGVVVTVCWAVLYSWYSVFDHVATPYFAFERISSPILRQTALYFLTIAQAYVVGYWLIRRAARISTTMKLAVVLMVLGPGVANVLLYPVGALDVFNYMVELKLTFHYGQNPYITTFDAYRSDPFALSAFLPHVPLFYGPIWLYLTGLPAILVGFDDPLRALLALKVFNLLLLALTALALCRYQQDDRRGWLAAYTLLANPLVLFEGVGNVHNDVLMTMFLVAALLALKWRSWLAAPLLALSALVKFFTALLAPVFALAMLLAGWSRRQLLLSALLPVAIAVAAAAPFWADGRMLDGLSQGTRVSQEMDHVSPFSLTQQYARERFPGQDRAPAIRRAFAGLFAVAMLLVLWAMRRGRSPERATVDALLLFFLLLTNLYPWYLIPVIAVLALRHDAVDFAFIAVATALGLLYYPLYVWAHFHSGLPKMQVHYFLALFVTVPIVAFLAVEAGRAGFAAARRGKG